MLWSYGYLLLGLDCVFAEPGFGFGFAIMSKLSGLFIDLSLLCRLLPFCLVWFVECEGVCCDAQGRWGFCTECCA